MVKTIAKKKSVNKITRQQKTGKHFCIIYIKDYKRVMLNQLGKEHSNRQMGKGSRQLTEE